MSSARRSFVGRSWSCRLYTCRSGCRRNNRPHPGVEVADKTVRGQVDPETFGREQACGIRRLVDVLDDARRDQVPGTKNYYGAYAGSSENPKLTRHVFSGVPSDPSTGSHTLDCALHDLFHGYHAGQICHQGHFQCRFLPFLWN